VNKSSPSIEWNLTDFSMTRGNETQFMTYGYRGNAILYQNQTTKLLLNNSYVHVSNNTKCLTIMECNSGGNDYCRPSDIRAKYSYQIRKGSYLDFKECGSPFSQSFVVDPWCGEYCSPEDMESSECVVGCMNAQYCYYNETKCANTTYSPTAPSVPGTSPTNAPSSQPTFAPLRLSSAPSPTATGEVVESFRPTSSPTRRGGGEGSKQPSLSPTASPTTYNELALAIGVAFGIIILCLMTILCAVLIDRGKHDNDHAEPANNPTNTLNSPGRAAVV
jgi:hypothetical protein